MTLWKPFLWVSFIALLPGTVLAGPVQFIQRAPADPQAIPAFVDQSQLKGVLPKQDMLNLIEAGRELFAARFTTADGAGRPLATQATIPTHFKHAREILFQRASGPEANSCTSCHRDPVAGGSGDFTANVFTSGGTESADFDNVDPQFSNERGTNHVFGAGLLELLSREMSDDLLAQQSNALKKAHETGQPATVALTTKGISFGKITVAPDGIIDLSAIEGIDDDLIVRPFSHKGVFVSLRLFSLNALNAHHGMQAEERFGAAMTGEADFDGDGFEHELSTGQVSAIVAYQATLEPPQPTPFENVGWQKSADAGEKIFTDIGCASCHVPYLPLKSLSFSDPGPFDTAGTLSAKDVDQPAIYDMALLDWAKKLKRNDKGEYLVPLFGDLKRHLIADSQYTHYANELMGQSFVPRDVFATTELWGVADTEPYGHRGDLTTIDEAIRQHGGEGRASRDAYAELGNAQQADLVTFLKTLRMPQ